MKIATAVRKGAMGFLMCLISPAAALGVGSPEERTTFAVDNAAIHLAPYVWKRTGAGATARAEAAMPGAYLKAFIQGSTTIRLSVDGTANRGCPASSMPVLEFSVDEGPYRSVPLAESAQVYVLPLADHLAADAPHRLELYFRAADLTRDRWKASTSHLRLAGITLDAGGSLLSGKVRPKRAIGFGDSITEGVGVDGLFSSWQSLGPNNARAAWFPVVCAALDCEYGQLGSGGQGMTRALEMPPLGQTWDRYDATTSRLTGGLLVPEPDYVFCCMGTNDFEKDITADYTAWLAAVRKACPHAHLFCVVPPLGVHKGEVQAAVAVRRGAGDRGVHLVDTAPLQTGFRAGKGPTQLASDGVHPSAYGSGMLAALIAVEVQKSLDGGGREGNGRQP